MISYCVTACNEHKELNQLLEQLIPYIKDGDEVLIQLDEHNSTDRVIEVATLASMNSGVNFIFFPLNNDFASFKNNLLIHAKNKWIFQIDADEMVSDFLLENIHFIVTENVHIEAFALPRVNLVKGLTQEWINKWGWRVSKGIVPYIDHYTVNILRSYQIEDYSLRLINFPDYQVRLFQNTGNIRWRNKVHEQLYKENGDLDVIPFPVKEMDEPRQECYHYCLFHIKEIDRQIRQNELYSKIND